MKIRPACIDDSDALTTIAFESKRHWNYPEEYFKIWEQELTITKEYIQNAIVYVGEIKEKAIGFYSVLYNPEDSMFGKVFVAKGYWLDHIFISPTDIRKGIGTKLMEHVRKTCSDRGISRLMVFSDPFSKGFYERIGANYLYDSASSIEGRTIPVFEIEITTI